MAVSIRLSRGGAKKRPYYRIVVADSRAPRDGSFIEKIGTYNPLLAKDDAKRVVLDTDRAKHWLAVGAQRPYDQGVAEAKAAALALLGHEVPPYISVPTLRVKKLDLLSALKQVTKEDAPASVVKICNGECF